MNKKIELNEKTELEKMACRLLMNISDIPRPPEYLTENHRQNLEYCNKFEKEFIKGLTYEQIKNYDSLMSSKNMTLTTEFDYMLLCGVQIKTALDELIKNLLKFMNLHDSSGDFLASNIYKSIKQKMQELDNA